MLFMVIEKFKNSDAKPVYRRFQQEGRMLPEGLNYVQSWVDRSFERCFQLMQCDDPILFEQWISKWQDLADFEIIPVVTSQEATEIITATL